MEKPKPFPRLLFKSKSLSKSTSIDSEDKILISLFNQKNRTGIAIFDEMKDEISMSSVVEIEANDFQNLFKFLASYPSSKYIVPQRCPKEFLENLKVINNFNKVNENEDQSENSRSSNSKEDFLENSASLKLFYSMSKSDFEYQFVIDSLLNANYEGALEPENLMMEPETRINFFDKKEKLMYLKGILDLDNVPMVCALGGLLGFLFQSSKLKRNFPIEKIKMKQPQKNVYINMKTYNSLSIIKEQIHPSQIKGKGRSKEGFSMLNLYDSMISTTHGRKLLRNWFLNPTYEIDILEERLYTVSFMLARLSSIHYEKIKKHLKKIYDLTLALKKFKNDTVTKDHWKKLEHTIESFFQIKAIFQNLIEENHLLNKDKLLPIIISKLLNFDDKEVIELQQIFVTILKFKDCSDRIEINNGVSEELDELKNLYENLDEVLTFYAKKELEKLPDVRNQKLSLTYMPHFGYLVSIPKYECYDTFEQENDENLDFSNRRKSHDNPNSSVKILSLKLTIK